MSTRDDELGTARFDAVIDCLDHSMCMVTATEVTDIEPGHPA